jgi:hypothetical protein
MDKYTCGCNGPIHEAFCHVSWQEQAQAEIASRTPPSAGPAEPWRKLPHFQLDFIRKQHAAILAHGWPLSNAEKDRAVLFSHIDTLAARCASQERELAELRGKMATLPADWTVDSSLSTWFPFTAERLEAAEQSLAAMRAALLEAREWLSGWASAESHIAHIDRVLKEPT